MNRNKTLTHLDLSGDEIFNHRHYWLLSIHICIITPSTYPIILIHLCIYLSIISCLFIYLSPLLLLLVSNHPYMHNSIYSTYHAQASICPSIYLSSYPFIHLLSFIYLFIYLSVSYQSIHLSVSYQSMYLSIISIYVSTHLYHIHQFIRQCFISLWWWYHLWSNRVSTWH